MGRYTPFVPNLMTAIPFHRLVLVIWTQWTMDAWVAHLPRLLDGLVGLKQPLPDSIMQ